MNSSLRRLPQLTLVLLLLATPPIWAQTDEDFHRSAFEKYTKGDYVGAIADFDRAIGLKSDNPEYFSSRGVVKTRTGDFAGAIVDYDRAITLKSDNPDYFYNRGNAKNRTGDYARAIADYDRAIVLKSDDPRYFGNRGNAKARNGDYANAIADYDRAIVLRSDNPDYFANRGGAKAFQGNHAGAIADYDRAIALKPDHAPAYRARGNLRQTAGSFEAAIADYDKAIALTPDGSEYARFYRHVTLRRLQRANPFAELAREVASWKEGWTKTVGLFLVEAVSEPAFFAKAAAGNPKTVSEQQCEAFYFAGMARLLAGDPTVARDYFEKCVATQETSFSEFNLARAELGRLAPAAK